MKKKFLFLIFFPIFPQFHNLTIKNTTPFNLRIQVTYCSDQAQIGSGVKRLKNITLDPTDTQMIQFSSLCTDQASFDISPPNPQVTQKRPKTYYSLSQDATILLVYHEATKTIDTQMAPPITV